VVVIVWCVVWCGGWRRLLAFDFDGPTVLVVILAGGSAGLMGGFLARRPGAHKFEFEFKI
jgi:hypothetical protein